MKPTGLVAVLLLSGSVAASAQVAVAPPLIYRPPSVGVMEDKGGETKLKILDAPGLNLGFSNGGDASVKAKTVRVGVYGRPKCEGEGANQKCVKHLAFSLDLNSNVIDGFKNHLNSLRDYLLSPNGAPFTLQPHVGFLSFNGQRDTVPQSYAAGEGVIDARLVPSTDANGKVKFHGAMTIGYQVEGHAAFDINNQAGGTAFISLKPTLSVMAGSELPALLLPAGKSKHAVFAIAYGLGIQFGGAGGKQIQVSGVYSFDDIAASKNQLKVGLQQAIGILGGKSQ